MAELNGRIGEIKLNKNNYFAFALSLICGIFIFIFGVIGSDLSFLPGDLIDGRFNNYILEHNFQYFLGNEGDFWNADFMFPTQNVICFSDNLIGTAPFYFPFRLIGLDRETSFQLWFLVICVLNFSSCYYFINNWIRNQRAAALGAYIFAFSLALQSQVTHVQVFSRFPIPLAFLMLHLFIQKFSPKYFLGLLLFSIWQFYCSIYLGFLLSITITIFLLIGIYVNREKFLKRIYSYSWIFEISIYLIFGLIVLSYLMFPYYVHSRNLGQLSNHEVALQSVPTISSYLFSQPGSLLWDGLSHHSNYLPAYWDHQIFTGILPILSCVIILYVVFLSKESNLRLGHYFYSICLTFLFFTRFGTWSLYDLIYNIPGFAAMKSLTRIVNIELLFWGMSISYCYHLLTRRYSHYPFFIFIIVLGLIVCDNYFLSSKVYRTEKKIAQERVDCLLPILTKVPTYAVVSYEPKLLDHAASIYHLDAMLACQSQQLKCVNAYSGNSPGSFTPFWNTPNEENRITWFKSMNLFLDSLFVLEDCNHLKVEGIKERADSISIKANDADLFDLEVKKMVQHILNDPEWLNHVVLKAKSNQISVDSMLTLDAIWVLKHQ